MNSRDVANNCVQASALDARCKWTRDPATAGAGRPSGDARRSIVPACRPGAVESVSLLDVSSSLTCAGPVTGAGGFFGRRGC